MAIETLPLFIDFTVYTYTTFRRQFRWRPQGTSGQDFAGWSALMLIGEKNGVAELEITSDDGIELDSNGLITITLTPEQSIALTHGSRYHVVDITDPGGASTRFFRGRLLVIHDLSPVPDAEPGGL